jgi:hypothetical protein
MRSEQWYMFVRLDSVGLCRLQSASSSPSGFHLTRIRFVDPARAGDFQYWEGQRPSLPMLDSPALLRSLASIIWLEDLAISNAWLFASADLVRLLASLPHLHSLELTESDLLEEDSVILQLKKMSQLRKLTLTMYEEVIFPTELLRQLCSPPHALQHLEELRAHGWIGFEEAEQLAQLPGLTKLSGFLPVEFLPHLDRLTHLQNLRLHSSSLRVWPGEIGPESPAAMRPHLALTIWSRLQKLELHELCFSESGALAEWAARLSQLTELAFTSCEFPFGLAGLEFASKLKKLTFFGCKGDLTPPIAAQTHSASLLWPELSVFEATDGSFPLGLADFCRLPQLTSLLFPLPGGQLRVTLPASGMPSTGLT